MDSPASDQFDRHITIGDRRIGPGAACFVIAEAGVSHFGSLEKAFALVDAAVAARADAVKFQIFRTAEMISGTDLEWTARMRPKELPFEAFREINDYCVQRGIIFFATAHDFLSLQELATLDPPLFKIGSGEVNNPEFYTAVARLGRPVVFSTGLHGRTDLEESLAALHRGGCRQVAVLHCITKYPVPPEDVNLQEVAALREVFPGPVGYSDHCSTHDIAAAAVLVGANVIEKHITLEKNIPNAQDWKVSCDPEELIQFVSSIRRLETAWGRRTSGDTERQSDAAWARKSIVLNQDLPEGTTLKREHLAFKRPGTGFRPNQVNDVLGKRLKVAAKSNAILSGDLIE